MVHSDFTYVEEGNPFLALFPHRFDYIYAEHSQPGQAPNWQTESRYPLADRLLSQGAYLYGVRFAAQTQYCLLDIDLGSAYHPQHDLLAVTRIMSALEPLGLVSYLACTSSYSGGIHLYFPFQQSQKSWELAIAVSTLLENAGFKLSPGQLEVFPNPKRYLGDSVSLFNAHRLPMQIGSYLLDRDFQPIWSDRHRFVQEWQQVQDKNQLDVTVFKRLLKQAQHKHYRVSGKADKFINDLNAEIELGWTGFGQTNRLLGRIALRAYVFHHVVVAAQPLEGKALVEEIVRTARSLPGYAEWCQHQHEIEQRAEEWARCVESSHYFHYGSQTGKYKSKDNFQISNGLPANQPTWNQRQSEAARERIRQAIADLLNQNSLPVGATARFRLLTQFGIGGTSLYRHRDLWHPGYLMPLEESGDDSGDHASDYLNDHSDNHLGDHSVGNLGGMALPVENPPDPPTSAELEEKDCVGDASFSSYLTSLLPPIGSNPLPALVSDSLGDQDFGLAGRNLLRGVGCLVDVQVLPVRLSSASQLLSLGDPDRHPDLSDLLAAISVQIRRLNWTPEQISDRLFRCLGKSQRSMLNEWELAQWLDWLEDYP
ncbi:MAG: hypothetical protein HC772_03025 [Leptolyngbyaceae cyanobacterium CRU_2_3]|nr:hypothetical protein [Leptolyngbyaceae cyanobacterium CRU_2_3]